MTPDDCVAGIRATVTAETTLTVSAGIAPNKMLAKVSMNIYTLNHNKFYVCRYVPIRFLSQTLRGNLW
jgi:nucleotidyltransferase/DNA polymerase involved in DNA repair